MRDSTFWRNLEARFRALQSSSNDGVRAEWHGIDARWVLRGAPSDSALRRFKQVAECAASSLPGRHTGSGVDRWVSALKRDTDAFLVRGSMGVREKRKNRFDDWGEIPRVCEVSADYCEKLADSAPPDLPGAALPPAIIPARMPPGSTPDTVKRRAIVKKNPDLSSRGLCQLFDQEGIPLTKRLREARSWDAAYKAPVYRHSIESLISRDRKFVSG
jgi:hypothetical protein